jgi:hypothetical protein
MRCMVPATDMKVKQTILSVSVALGVLLVSVPRSLAHHSRMMFDMSQNVTYQGSHIVITVGPDAKNSSTAGTWNIEASSVNIMAGEGWSQMTYKPGDPITVVAHPMKNRSKGALLFYAIKPDGTRLYRAQHQYDSETE